MRHLGVRRMKEVLFRPTVWYVFVWGCSVHSNKLQRAFEYDEHVLSLYNYYSFSARLSAGTLEIGGHWVQSLVGIWPSFGELGSYSASKPLTRDSAY